MQWWDIVGAVVCFTVCGFFLLVGIALWRVGGAGKAAIDNYAEEKARWEALRGAGVRATAEVMRLTRPDDRLTMLGEQALEVAATDLVLRYADRTGAPHETAVLTFIDVELLAGFGAGREIGIVYAATAPDVVAIDRDRTPLEIPPTPAR